MRQCYPQNAKLTWIDTMRHAKVFRIAETPVFDKAHSRHHNKPDPYLQDCESNCKPDRPWNVSFREETVKGAVSSHNLKFRATEINENSVKIKQLQRYFILHWTKHIEQGRRWAKYSRKEELKKLYYRPKTSRHHWNYLKDAQSNRLKTKLKQAHTYAKSDSQLKPEQAQDYAKSC